jgi:hypothetical protein
MSSLIRTILSAAFTLGALGCTAETGIETSGCTIENCKSSRLWDFLMMEDQNNSLTQHELVHVDSDTIAAEAAPTWTLDMREILALEVSPGLEQEELSRIEVIDFTGESSRLDAWLSARFSQGSISDGSVVILGLKAIPMLEELDELEWRNGKTLKSVKVDLDAGTVTWEWSDGSTTSKQIP